MGKGTYPEEMKVRLPSEILQKIDAIAKREFTTRSEIMRKACVDYVRREMPDPAIYPVHTEDIEAFSVAEKAKKRKPAA